MATTTFLSNATVNITQGATTYDVSDQVRSATLSVGYDSLEATAMGDTGRRFVQGLQSVSVSLECYLSYGGSGATSEIETMCAALVGQGSTNLVISPSGTTILRLPLASSALTTTVPASRFTAFQCRFSTLALRRIIIA